MSTDYGLCVNHLATALTARRMAWPWQCQWIIDSPIESQTLARVGSRPRHDASDLVGQVTQLIDELPDAGTRFHRKVDLGI